MQDFLTRTGIPTTVDGRFGPATRTKVRAWEGRARVSNAGANAASIRIDGRMPPAEAALLRLEVEQTEAGQSPAPAPALLVTPTEKATLAADGSAVAPASAPEAVKQIIAAGNEIHDKPYRYGGGHANRIDSGYDCSGSMSYAFQGAGMLKAALNSSGFAQWGEAGPGQWVTVYANAGHSYMVVAGLRFDTSGRSNAGSRWQTNQRPTNGYAVRHPAGL
jgi:cell wall-associated NlpC family hydrolase